MMCRNPRRIQSKFSGEQTLAVNKRLATAFGAYAVLIAIALFALHGTMLYVVLLVFALFMAKTLIAHKAGW